ncbi:hypothetical protein [Methylobacterium sp. J-068]|uniref:hypothetical protein n=1 Tax=Methylobacterium sp. J-068 TaxID=2836649 RepID=UPI001FB902F8|nr:hypothetical protein [Methylobacterium sp. J-068]MCJ2033212.1 hypothetical protein [Methylobacterium sp. J-068]
MDLILPHESGAVTRRGGIARGLRDALAATGPLPRPLGLAASVLGAGLDVLGGDGRPTLSIDLRFEDGATASIRADAETAARMSRDREVVRLAVLRRATAPIAAPAGAAPAAETRWPETPGPDAPALASIFAYEKRGGRLRRLAAKARDDA